MIDLAQAVAGILAAEHGALTALDLRASPLDGGHVARGVTRLDAAFTRGGEPGRRSFVQKYVDEAEIAALRLLKPLAGHVAAPVLLADGRDEQGRWVVMPFLAGESLAGRYELPPDVVETLARVHSAYAGPGALPDGLARIGHALWRDLLGLARRRLAEAPWPLDDPRRAAVASGLDALERAAWVPHVLQQLPAALLHGDVHGGNMIACSDDGRTYLVDWGNARIGPAAVDLANCADSPEDPAWRQYWRRVAELTGAVPGAHEQQLGFHAARALVNLQYLGFAIDALGAQRAADMVERALESAAACMP